MPYVSCRGHQLFYESHGSGVPLLFISGTGWNGSHWSISQVPFFEHDYEVITFDHRGTGSADPLDELYTTMMFSDDAIELLDALHIDQPHVVGHSMGGKIALRMALDHPSRVRSLVLAGVNPGSLDGKPRTASISTGVIESLLREGWPGYFEYRLGEKFMFFQGDQSLIEILRQSLRGERTMDLASYLGHIIARQDQSSAPRLGEVQQPCLIICGAEDDDPPSLHLTASKVCVERIPNAKLVVLPDTAHALHIESSLQFNTFVAEFLLGL